MLRPFHVEVTFIIVTVDFLQNWNISISHNTWIDLLGCNKRQKQRKFFQFLALSVVTSEYFLVLFWSRDGYLSGLLPVLQSKCEHCPSAVCTPPTLSQQPPPNDRNNTKRQKRKNVFIPKQRRIWGQMQDASHLNFLLQIISPKASLNTLKELCNCPVLRH